MPVRTVGETSYRIRELRLRFYNSHTMMQPSEEVLTKIGLAALTAHAAGHCLEMPITYDF